jgi:hypothetical protein
LPDESFLKPWVELHDFAATVRAEASSYLAGAREAARADFGDTHPRAMAELSELLGALEKSYG